MVPDGGFLHRGGTATLICRRSVTPADLVTVADPGPQPAPPGDPKNRSVDTDAIPCSLGHTGRAAVEGTVDQRRLVERTRQGDHDAFAELARAIAVEGDPVRRRAAIAEAMRIYKEDVIPDGKQIVARGDGATTDFPFANDFPASRTAAAPRHVQVFKGTAAGAEGLVHGRDYTLEGLGSATVTVKFASAPAATESVVIRAGRSLVGAGAAKEIALAPTMTVKAIGYQWGWSYAYPDFGDFEFASNMLPEDKTTPELYRFDVDNRVVVPVGETIRVVTTARDVIHAFALPNFAIKIDAVPGRINETWFKADREGVFFGQCSEICGVRHSAMPIAVEVVSRAKFEAWVDSQRALAGLQPMFGAAPEKFAAAPAADAAAQ